MFIPPEVGEKERVVRGKGGRSREPGSHDGGGAGRPQAVHQEAAAAHRRRRRDARLYQRLHGEDPCGQGSKNTSCVNFPSTAEHSMTHIIHTQKFSANLS
jgi:hypothetical protein